MIFDTPNGIAFAQLAARKAALSLEIRGLRRHGRSAYSICKSEYGLKGSRESVLRQMQALVDQAIADRLVAREELVRGDQDQSLAALISDGERRFAEFLRGGPDA